MNITLIGTGALSVCHLPFWLNWFDVDDRVGDVRVVLTRNAADFVSPRAVAALTRRDCAIDEWGDGALHRELEAWTDVFLVHPASLHYLMRLAGGLAETPTLLTLQCTSKPIGLAPSLPPGADTNPVIGQQLAALRSRPNLVVADTVPTISVSTGETVDTGPAPLNELFDQVLRTTSVAV